MKTKTLRGPVSNLQVDHVQSGAGEFSAACYRATLNVGGHRVTYASPRRIAISDGDEVAVCGSEGTAAFTAMAYRNVTTGAEGNQGLFGARAVTVGVLLLCVVTLIQGSLLAVVFGTMAAFFHLCTARLADAIDELHSGV